MNVRSQVHKGSEGERRMKNGLGIAISVQHSRQHRNDQRDANEARPPRDMAVPELA
ncbi:MAG: hypothetical protein ACM3ZQ_08390 [Bacillota bacterium]